MWINSSDVARVDGSAKRVDRNHGDRTRNRKIHELRLNQIGVAKVVWLPIGIVITRRVRIAWSKRYPANLIIIKRNEGNERRCIRRRYVSPFRNPVPLISRIDPATVVIWRVSPRLIRY